tara:strand:- start:16 stop:276 length:261 start_codon:yes stop_codon:yes gene_type:complete
MNTEQTTPVDTCRTTRRGRPPVKLDWPEGSFTVSDVKKTSGQALSNVSIQLKINKAVSDGALQVVGKVSSGMGRPKVTYRKTTGTP